MPPTSVTTSTIGQMLQPGTVSLPPVTPRIRDKIISGEFVNFATLLPNAMFSGSTGTEASKSLTVQLTPVGNDLSVRPQPSAKKINSFASWMEAWNIYLAILINRSPARAPQLVAYQRIITSASTQYPLAAWLNYDIQFRTLAASDTSLRWDTRHTDLWLQCVTAPSLSTIRWPCSHCGATNHYPRNCPFRPHAIPAPTDSHRQANAPSSSSGQHAYSYRRVTQLQTVLPTTAQFVAARHVNSFTNASFVGPATVPRTVPTGAALLNKPKPWTPVRSFILERELCNHPDKTFVKKLIYDLCHGCTIGYTGPQFSYLANNLLSAYQQPKVIDDTLKKECELGRILGPFESPPLPNFRTSGLGLVPKHDGGWRTIYHLSAPPNSSINDFINPDDYSLSYCSIDDAYSFINALGPGTLLSKIDLKDAFRLIPVNPSDWNLLGIQWRGEFYVDTCLPFGLRSAPYLINRLSQAIHWILANNYGVQHLLRYLDDFLTVGPADSPVCYHNLNAMLSLCQNINAPVKTSKI